MKKVLTSNDLQKLFDAHDALRGTKEYMKYQMPHECKFRMNGKWSAWKWIGWDVGYSLNEATIKKVGSKVYIMRKWSENEVDRWEVTDEVNQLLNIY